MGCDPGGFFHGAAVQKVRRDAGGAEGVAADSFGESRKPGVPLDHPQRVICVHASLCQLAVPVERSEEGSRLLLDSGLAQVGIDELDVDDISMTVTCAECGDTYNVENRFIDVPCTNPSSSYGNTLACSGPMVGAISLDCMTCGMPSQSIA